MEVKKRLVAKSFTWQVAGFVSMTVIGFLFTGSIAASGGIALAGAAAGFVGYFMHELAWTKINWGRGAHWRPRV